jgi:hypothetical protein
MELLDNHIPFFQRMSCGIHKTPPHATTQSHTSNPVLEISNTFPHLNNFKPVPWLVWIEVVLVHLIASTAVSVFRVSQI